MSLNRSKALKGAASTWLAQNSYEHATWPELKNLFLARFGSAETPAAAVFKILNSSPNDGENISSYASRILSILMNRWKNLTTEQIATTVALAHVSRIDAQIQRLTFTTEISSRTKLQQELMPFVYKKRPLPVSERNYSSTEAKKPKFYRSCYNCGKTGHLANECRRVVLKENSSVTNQDPNQANASMQRREPSQRTIICYRCGQPGHIAPSCPTKSGKTFEHPDPTERRVDICTVSPASGDLYNLDKDIAKTYEMRQGVLHRKVERNNRSFWLPMVPRAFQLSKCHSGKIQAELHTIPKVACPWHTIHIDATGKLTGKNDLKESWQDALPEVQIALNCSFCRVTKSSPLELLIGKTARPLNLMIPNGDRNDSVDLPLVREQAAQSILTHANTDKVKFNKTKAKIKRFKVGDYVLLENHERNKTKLDPKFKGPYLIAQLLCGDRYLLKALDSKRTYKYAHDRLRALPECYVPLELDPNLIGCAADGTSTRTCLVHQGHSHHQITKDGVRANHNRCNHPVAPLELNKLPNSPQQPQQPFKPRPMSGVSHFIPRNLPPTGHDWRKFGNPPPSNYFKTHHMNAEERANLINLCASYADVFYLEGEPLTFTNKIKTTDEIPVHTKSYRYPHVHRQEVRDQIKKMLEQNIIRPSESAWSSPIWIVPKKADASNKIKWRLVVDFRKANEKTVDDKYPIPNITDVLDKLGKCQHFTTLDLASGFYQVEMDPADVEKTAFNVENGHYEFLRMPMGLKNSPSTFQRVMDNVLKDLQNQVFLVYLDDIIVFSTSLQEHVINLEKVFKKLRESNFKIQMDKSEFLKLETEFLGHIIIGRDGVKPNPNKIQAIQNYPLPKTTIEIKRFLGLLGYYRKFIPNFARVTKPLTNCLKKGNKITLDQNYKNCFEHCKTLLTNDPILQYPDFSKDFILTTDASNVAIGAVLSQGNIGTDKPIAYASRTLNDSETNYSTIEKELLAIVWATKYFRPYLFGRKFKIITDHRPLQWVMNLKEPNSRLTRWRLKLSEYDFSVTYKQGKYNTNADALSRIELNNEELSSIIVNPSTSDDSRTLTAPDVDENSSTATAHTSAENPILEIPISDYPLNKFTKQIVFNIVGDIKGRPSVTKPFDAFTRINLQVSQSNLEEDVVNAIKEHVLPKINTGLRINPALAMYQIIPIIQNNFKNSAMRLFVAKREVENELLVLHLFLIPSLTQEIKLESLGMDPEFYHSN
ncbi:LOW QUALITY PROTEIN: uncharacterized protein LOC133320633 [Danaus plexippus]|uniref:LOW QUALITY PROTEIN: uncharacterized protein LOC133320633 n=1 Tax=Danaus plexippus TaxID=13037 RepID=UPI002AB11FBD|nr:LOW QUALITY PROTEIN: uncharacterized protein LOC133320633 [Danaus plexippus]